MYQITQLGSEPKQAFSMYLDDGSQVDFVFVYKPNQLGWFFDFTYNQQTYRNIRLTTCYNLLRAYQSWLPLGLRCDTLDGFEPLDIDDFDNGYATVYLLTRQDVDAIEGKYYAKVDA